MSLRDHAGINAGDPTVPRLLEGLITPPEWTREAICAQVDPDLFFPDKGGNAKPAKRMCMGCPVRAQCLAYALAYESGENGVALSYAGTGIYGGLTGRERRRILRKTGLDTLQEPA